MKVVLNKGFILLNYKRAGGKESFQYVVKSLICYATIPQTANTWKRIIMSIFIDLVHLP